MCEALGYGVIKMNIDTDTQWSMWDGCKDYVAKNSAYLQSQIGNPEGGAGCRMRHAIHVMHSPSSLQV